MRQEYERITAELMNINGSVSTTVLLLIEIMELTVLIVTYKQKESWFLLLVTYKINFIAESRHFFAQFWFSVLGYEV